MVPAIAAEMPDRWRAAVYVMASTGLRLGECLGLTVDRVDFLRRTIRIDRQMVTVKGSTSFGTPKTRAGVRTIPVPETITDMLAGTRSCLAGRNARGLHAPVADRRGPHARGDRSGVGELDADGLGELRDFVACHIRVTIGRGDRESPAR